MKRYYQQHEFTGDLLDLIRQISQKGFKPNYIAGIVRGGLVPAVYLAQYYGISVIPVRCSTRDLNEPVNVAELVEIVRKGGSVLIVDDIVDSGSTFAKIHAMLKDELQPFELSNKVRTAALFWNPSQDEFDPDFHVNELDRSEDDSWIVFPYEEFWRGLS